MNFPEEIKAQLSAKDVFEFYGLNTNSKGFVCCPFHAEKTPSMRVYDGKRGFFCFGCGANGDVISFVMKFFSLPFSEAIAKLNEDFCLGLPIGEKISRNKKIELARRSFERKKEINLKKEEFEKLTQRYWDAYDLWIEFDRNKREFFPKDQEEDFHPLFVEAVHGIGAALNQLEEAELALYEYKNR